METIEVDKNRFIEETATTLNMINYQIADLTRIKEQLEGKLVALIEHPDDGQRKYIYGRNAITVSTGWNYSLDKDEYEIMASHLPECFNPVRMKQVYELDKKVIRECELYGSAEQLNVMSTFISKKPKKIHVKVTSGV